ncbi:uncharacterized protein LY89DRAFT_684853 [Mollisia scopiformis]|uniref:Uncharacterized protein n=1 Tax=Mollisia scopiformis TaxID=149040 RepID=A0A194X9L0_MOLSC|nr:uncharacterized protein LY89DRAFT_684853 [Mollisia scopiformis]KUJ16814.1 hypothetical protein LY89DRAFT_684853 [Mollisia scopiformis]
MALFNPFYGLILPFLFIFTIPIAILASITTACAFSVLLFRVTLVYIELALAVIPHWLLGGEITAKQLRRTKSLTNTSPGRRKRRRGSTSSNASATGMLTPVSSDNVMGLSAGPTRDYEGVGGWRIDNPSDDDALWTKINSRLELPADHVRRHHRSLTSGSMPGESTAKVNRSYSPEAIMNTSRARTPPSSAIIGRDEGYFPQIPISSKTSKRNSSSTGSTTSSKGSGLCIKPI